jgi:RNA polymerase sigma-70 factor, ECF subfamily
VEHADTIRNYSNKRETMPDNSWTQIARVTSPNKADPTNVVQDEVVRLFAELRAPLLRYLHFLGLTVGDGEDVVQEAFLALFSHLSAGKPRDNLHGWIFRVARNIALKRIHQTGASVRMTESLQVVDFSANPEERAVRNQQGRAIQATIEALSELDRQCLCLRAEGLRYREIASVLDVSLGSVALALGRAVAKLSRIAQKKPVPLFSKKP